MAAPNILNLNSITGKTATANVTTSYSNVIVNAASSSTLVKINNILLSNYTANAAVANIVLTRSGVNNYLGGSISVPGQSVLILIGKDTSFYLEEGDYLQANTSTNNSINLTSGYEILQ
jgi:hypothetical protein